MSSITSFFTRHPWLYLLLTNLVLAGLTWCAFVLTIGFAIGENYHPDGYSRSLYPIAGVVFGVLAIATIGSLVWWIKRKSATGKRCLALVAVTLVVSACFGTVAYLFTEEKPATRIYEFLGNTYEIPREYSPSMPINTKSGKATLSIDVCGNAPMVGKYDRLAKQAIAGSCEQGNHMIQPLINGLPSYFNFALEMIFRDGRHGFTVATSTTNAAFLNPINPGDLDGTRTDIITRDNVTIITSRDGGLHKDNFYLEFVDNELQWMTVCSLWDCQNHAAYPDETGYALRADVYNRAQYERGYLTEQEIIEYKQLHKDVYDLFNSFIIVPSE